MSTREQSVEMLNALGYAAIRQSGIYSEAIDPRTAMGLTCMTVLMAAMRHPEWAQAYIQQAAGSFGQLRGELENVAEVLIELLPIETVTS